MLDNRLQRLTLVWICLLAVSIGIVTGLGAVVFRALVDFVHNLFFYGNPSFEGLGAGFGPPSVFGPLVVLSPVVGGLIVVWIVKTFAPEAKGHGVPEVMEAIYYRDGHIRPVVAGAKILASALSIGSGASVGREGPIIQIGAAFGSTVGQALKMAPSQLITLVAAGAGAGIAATFNTPLAAVLFATELLLPEISNRTFLPVVIATGTATFVGQLFFGPEPAFILPDLVHLDQRIDLVSLLAAGALGILAGVAAALFVRLLTALEEGFEKAPGNDYVKNAAGMFVVGLLFYGLFLGYGHYHVEGVGYATIEAILNGGLTGFGLLALLFVAKLLATTISLGAGASGGVFAPSLFLGATLGGAFGAFVNNVLGFTGLGIGEYAMIGMAALVGGGTGAAMTAIVMIFEMVRDYHIVFPAIIATALAVGTRRLLSRENIYTVKLAWRGRQIPTDRHSNMFLVRRAGDVMSRNVAVLPDSMTVQEGLRAIPALPDSEYVIVAQGGRIRGVILVPPSLHRLEEVRGSLTLGEIADRQFIVAGADRSMFEIFPRMKRRHARYVLVVDGGGTPRAGRVQGVVARAQITDAVLENFGARAER